MVDQDPPDEQAPRLIVYRPGESPGAMRGIGEALASPPGALEYYAAERERVFNRPPTITLMPEYGVEVPLWPQADETEDLVSDRLKSKLEAWQATFDSHFSWDSGWDSEEAKAAWASDAKGLEAELRNEVAGIIEVEVDLWPLNPGYLHTGQPELPPPN